LPLSIIIANQRTVNTRQLGSTGNPHPSAAGMSSRKGIVKDALSLQVNPQGAT